MMADQNHSNPIAEALKRGGPQGLLAGVPVVARLQGKQTEAVAKVLSQMSDGELTSLRKSSAARSMLSAANKLAMKEPMVLGATIVPASMGHWAWNGYHHAQRTHRRHEREADGESFRDREDHRRGRQQQEERAH